MPMDLSSAEVMLHGHNPLAGVVALEPAGRFFRLFIRDNSGVTIQDQIFEPFILLSRSDLLKKSLIPCRVESLSEKGRFSCLAKFDTWHDCCAAKEYLEKMTGQDASHPEAPFQFINDSIHQFLLRTGITFYKGLAIEMIRAMAVDISFCRCDGNRVAKQTLSITVACSSGFEESFTGDSDDEPDMLKRLAQIIAVQDPDLIVGYDLLHGGISEICRSRTKQQKKFPWGRNGDDLRLQTTHTETAGGEWPHCEVYGRSVIDLKILLRQNNNIAHRLDHYCSRNKEAKDILATFADLAPLLYEEASIFPYSLQSMPSRISPVRVNSLFLREYLRRGIAVPARSASSSLQISTPLELKQSGLTGPVVHFDCSQLYIAIILSYRLAPENDTAGIFLPFLSAVRNMTENAINCKNAAASGFKNGTTPLRYCAISVLLNSFPALLGGGLLNFADFSKAAETYRLGHVVIRDLICWLKEDGAQPVEVIRDGIFFVPPPGEDGTEQVARLTERLASSVPARINCQHPVCYRNMLIYKPGNFALLDYNNQLSVKGTFLNSRGLEPYLLDFLHDALHFLLNGQASELNNLYRKYFESLKRYELDINWIARTETITELPDNYLAQVNSGKRHRSAIYELALKKENGCRIGDRISYYIVGSSPDITIFDHSREIKEYDPDHSNLNLAWYAERLRQILRRITRFIPEQPELF